MNVYYITVEWAEFINSKYQLMPGGNFASKYKYMGIYKHKVK